MQREKYLNNLVNRGDNSITVELKKNNQVNTRASKQNCKQLTRLNEKPSIVKINCIPYRKLFLPNTKKKKKGWFTLEVFSKLVERKDNKVSTKYNHHKKNIFKNMYKYSLLIVKMTCL